MSFNNLPAHPLGTAHAATFIAGLHATARNLTGAGQPFHEGVSVRFASREEIQERYGIAKEEAQKQADEFVQQLRELAAEHEKARGATQR